MADPAQRRALVRECVTDAHSLMAAVTRINAPAWLDLDITMGQFKALMAIVADEPLSVGALGRVLGIAEPSASLLVDKLEGQGLARREADSEDRRRTLVRPTEAARGLLERLQQGRRGRIDEFIKDLDDDELAALACGIAALARAAEAAGGEPPAASEAHA